MRHLLFGSILLASIVVAAAAVAGDLAKARQELASTGKLRVGVVSAPKADAFFVVKNAYDRPRGVTVDLGDELARTSMFQANSLSRTILARLPTRWRTD